jgi:hypothetical protein
VRNVVLAQTELPQMAREPMQPERLQ